MARREVVIYFDLSEPRTGIWCDTCNLPSAAQFDITTMSEHGVSVIATLTACTECLRRW